MFNLALSYHQVMLEYLEFIHPFGKQLYAQDFYYAGFRDVLDLTEPRLERKIPTLGRSGIGFEITYTLFSVEEPRKKSRFPWAVRRASVYHSFDLENPRAVWILTKGNHLLEDRIRSATESHASEFSAFSTADQALSSALNTHLLICEWASENWRWYIGFLEENLQSITRHIVAVPLESPPVINYDDVEESIASSPTSTSGKSSFSLTKRLSFKARRILTPNLKLSDLQPRTIDEVVQPPAEPDSEPTPAFSYSELQQVQTVKEKAAEALLVLQTNTSIIQDLGSFYQSIVQVEDGAKELGDAMRRDIGKFKRRIANIEHDLLLQQSRLSTVIRLIEDRKDLV